MPMGQRHAKVEPLNACGGCSEKESAGWRPLVHAHAGRPWWRSRSARCVSGRGGPRTLAIPVERPPSSASSRAQRRALAARGARRVIYADDWQRRRRVPAHDGRRVAARSPRRRASWGCSARSSVTSPTVACRSWLRRLVGAPGDAAGGLRALPPDGSVPSRVAAVGAGQERATPVRAGAKEGSHLRRAGGDRRAAPSQVESLLGTERTARGLDEPAGWEAEDGATVGELLADPRAEETYERVPQRVLAAQVPALLAQRPRASEPSSAPATASANRSGRCARSPRNWVSAPSGCGRSSRSRW